MRTTGIDIQKDPDRHPLKWSMHLRRNFKYQGSTDVDWKQKDYKVAE